MEVDGAICWYLSERFHQEEQFSRRKYGPIFNCLGTRVQKVFSTIAPHLEGASHVFMIYPVDFIILYLI